MEKAYDSIDIAWARLREYLGDGFNESNTDFHSCNDYSDIQFLEMGEKRFYSESDAYLYELTHFHFTPYKDKFFEMVISVSKHLGLYNLADFGCGIGLDGQALMRYGYNVDFFDIVSPSTAYLEWRLSREMGNTSRVTNPYGAKIGTYDIAIAVDVLEHLPDPEVLLKIMFESSRFVCFNLFPHDLGPRHLGDLHYPQNHWALLPMVSRYGQLLQVQISGDTIGMLYKSNANL